MKKRNLLTPYSLTEKVLIFISVTLVTAIFVSSTARSGNWLGFAFADEGSSSDSDSDEGSSSDDSESEDDNDETSSNDSEDDNDEASVSDDETSVPEDDENSIDEPSVQEQDEVSVQESDEVSTEVEDETELSQEKSFGIFSGGAPYEGMFDEDNFSEVMEFEGGEKLVKREEKLFFLIPVDIESTVSVDDQGMIVAVRQSIWQRILSWLSF